MFNGSHEVYNKKICIINLLNNLDLKQFYQNK